MPRFLYFAYGSNMSTERLRGRTPSARPVGIGRLPHHRRCWHKRGRDGSGKCDVVFAGVDSDEAVWGVLFEIDEAEKAALHRAEGLGVGYLEKTVAVLTEAEVRRAMTYQAKPGQTDAALRPFAWYKAHVVRGAREHGLPADCVRELEAVAVQPTVPSARSAAKAT